MLLPTTHRTVSSSLGRSGSLVFYQIYLFRGVLQRKQSSHVADPSILDRSIYVNIQNISNSRYNPHVWISSSAILESFLDLLLSHIQHLHWRRCAFATEHLLTIILLQRLLFGSLHSSLMVARWWKAKWYACPNPRHASPREC